MFVILIIMSDFAVKSANRVLLTNLLYILYTYKVKNILLIGINEKVFCKVYGLYDVLLLISAENYVWRIEEKNYV